VRTFVLRSTLLAILSSGSVAIAGGPQTDPEGTSLLVARKAARRGTAGDGSNELNSVVEPDEPLAPSPVAFDPLPTLVNSSRFLCHVRARVCSVDDVTAGRMHKHSAQ
jgi:hypothetical protein